MCVIRGQRRLRLDAGDYALSVCSARVEHQAANEGGRCDRCAGATGTIGRPLVEQLLGSGQSVRAVIHRAGAESLPAGIDVVECDLSA
jgi:hypothetical protein